MELTRDDVEYRTGTVNPTSDIDKQEGIAA